LVIIIDKRQERNKQNYLHLSWTRNSGFIFNHPKGPKAVTRMDCFSISLLVNLRYVKASTFPDS